MNVNLQRQLPTIFAFFLILSIILLKDVDASSLPVQGHCSVTYKDRIYIFGGSLNDLSSPQNCFLSIQAPFDIVTTNNSSSGDNLEWTVEEQKGSTCVSYAACVTTSSGYLLVIGGIQSWNNNTSSQTFQIYDFNAAQWVESSKKLDEPYPGASYGPSATFLSTNLLFIYGGNTLNLSEVSFQSTALFLDISGEKWYWTKKNRSSKIDETDASYSGIISVNSNTWIFGGSVYSQVHKNLSNSDKIYTFNTDKQWIPANVSLPLAVEQSAIGLRKKTLFVVGYSNETLLVWSFDLVSQKFVEVSRNTSISVQKFAHTQFPGSDALMLHGNFCPKDETKELCSTTGNGVGGGVVLIAISIGIVFCIRKRRKNHRTKKPKTNQQQQTQDENESGGDDILPTVVREPSSSQINTSSSILSTEIDPFSYRSSQHTSHARGSIGSRTISPTSFRPEISSLTGESPKDSQIMDDLPLPPPPVADHYAGRSSIGQQHGTANLDNLPMSFYSHENGNSSPPREYNL
ncbi:5955_t:CDS:2 [Ambispora leptoticha]|uniref:5955_t:CDS:1 n=1 Tax=Ambispora leptoticha TaxID=144679 RepID=A0A9N9F2S1_9GLOM|nr:5955_t:CDS:2 [Ambispora leptoticha]